MIKLFAIKAYLIFLSLLSFSIFVNAQIAIDTSFEGANARIIDINNLDNEITIESKHREGDKYNIVFYLGVSGCNQKLPLKIKVKNSNQVHLPTLIAFSYDKKIWHRIRGEFYDNVIEYEKVFSQNPIYFSVGYPYVYKDLTDLADSLDTSPSVTISDIALSEKGRAVKLFKFTDSFVPDSGKYLIWVLGRNHAFESHSSYVIEGLIKFLASNDEQAICLRQQAIIYIVPIMDVDMVSIGGSGKDQSPVDFNRYWELSSHWNAVTAVKNEIAETSKSNQLKLFIDSHDPWPGSDEIRNQCFFYSTCDSGEKSENLDLFRTQLKNKGGYEFKRRASYSTEGLTAAKFIDSFYPDIDISTSMETGWVNRTDSVEWTIPLYYNQGKLLGQGISDYIQHVLYPHKN